MRRNLDARMETVMPVLDAVIKEDLEQILAVYENDNVTAWDMQPDASYVRRTPAPGEELRPSQEIFIRLAADQSDVEDTPVLEQTGVTTADAASLV
jgi:polyphosphate kinase